MLKFFRQIRQQLLKENQLKKSTSPAGRYALYAIGEILLVVIGILIALYINNRNEEQRRQEKINVYLQNLKKDLETDIESMKYMESKNMFRFHSMNYLLQMADLPINDPKKDGMKIPNWQLGNSIWDDDIPQQYDSAFIKLAFLWTHRKAQGSITSSTMEEWKSTGLYAHLANTELKNAIRSYYELAKFRVGFDGSSVIENWVLSLLKEGIHNGEPFIHGDPIALIKKDREREGLLRRNIRQSGWMIEGSPLIIKEAQSLIRQIEKVLDE